MDQQIITKDVEALRRRNRYKRENLDTLISTSKVSGMPYRVYYMSCNVEHVFGGDRNCTSEQKLQISNRLSHEYAASPAAFREILISYGDSAEDWLESWNALQHGVSSLRRGTNIRFAIPGL